MSTPWEERSTTHNAYHAHSVGDDFVILRRGETLDMFHRGEKQVGEIIELMAGGAELQSLLSQSEKQAMQG